MLEKISYTIEKYNMLKSGETVCCALSGGADSVALLLALKKLSAEFGVTVTAVHINHLLRGDESDSDESFCRDLCSRLNIPLTVFRRNAAAFAHSLGASVETGAREMRYRIFSEISADKIATAHNLNDNAETLIFRIARGTGLRGLAGIPPVRDNIIRPLLRCSRDEIEAFLAEEGQDFVTDSTNLSESYTRNKIRRRIIPEMSALHGAFPDCVTAMTTNFSEDEDYLSQQAERLKNKDLRTLHPAVRKRIIINLLKSHRLEVNAKRAYELENAALGSGGKIDVGNGFTAFVRNGKINIAERKTENIPQQEPQEISEEGEYPFSSDRIVTISKINCEKMNVIENVNKNSTTDLLDYDKIKGSIVLRNRLRKDKIKPAGSAHTREIRKLLQERLPYGMRDLSAVIEDSLGIVWAEHIGADERVTVDENSVTAIKINVCPKQQDDIKDM
ncbi:MAG: tRNA lysidine(34) synthetase TilS [Oscillospiraceae bacterium]|nr:tRNA lysidine(34) synthetase TilS [Oscillospiraceae bacterium]